MAVHQRLLYLVSRAACFKTVTMVNSILSMLYYCKKESVIVKENTFIKRYQG